MGVFDTARFVTVLFFCLIMFACGGDDTEGNNNADAQTNSTLVGNEEKNHAPVADIDVVYGVIIGQTVNANGSNSHDEDADALSYRWSLIAPNGSAAMLSSHSDEMVNFTADIAGTYKLSLVVNDGTVDGVIVERDVIAQAALSGQKLSFKSTSNTTQNAVPFTFATVFAKGEQSAGQQFNLQLDDTELLAVQTNVKALHNDGSLRHAIFSGSLPILAANTDLQVELVRADHSPQQSVASLNDLLNSGWDAKIDLMIDATSYSLSAASLLANQTPNLWLDGPLVKEWAVYGELKDGDGKAHPHLAARLNIRVYGNLEHVLFDVILENNWAYELSPTNITYSAEIKVNNQLVYSVQDLKHLRHARWRKQFWTDGLPALHISHDPAYLIATGAVPNFDPTLIGNISQAQIEWYKNNWIEEEVVTEVDDNGYFVPVGSGGTQFKYNKIGTMGAGLVEPGMPNTGARPDIGPLPRWTSIYMLDQSEISKKVMLGIADLAGSWPIHYRQKQTQLPPSIDDYPYASSHPDPNLSFNPNSGLSEQLAQCASASAADCVLPYIPDTAHQPSLAYIPYLITGDYYYLEELHFWANYNYLEMNPHYRKFEQGLFDRDMQERGQAWSLRTAAHAAYITPDDHPMKSYFESKLQANIDHYHDKYVVNTPNTYGAMIPLYSYPTASPWMDDFFTWVVNHLVDLDYQSAQALLEYKALFSIQRMGFASNAADDYCWIFASTYHLLVAPTANDPMFQTIAETYNNTNGQAIPYDGGFNDFGHACASSDLASALGLQTGEMIGYSSSPTGFPSNLQIALAAAVNSQVAGANDAWERFIKRSVIPDYSAYPNYAIVPRVK